MDKLLKITAVIAYVVMFALVVGQIYMTEGRRQGKQDFAWQVKDLQARIAEIEQRLQEEEDSRIDYLVYRIITCESGRRHDIWGDNGLAYGIAQFHSASFYDMAKKAGLQHADWHNQHQQILLLKWAVWQGIADKHWTRCYKEAVNDNL